MRYAIIRDGVVENVVLWDGEADWSPPADTLLVPCPPWVSTGASYDGEAFSAPPPPVSSREPVRVSKADFQRLLTPTERYSLNALRKQIATLTPADYPDPANALLVAAEDVMFAFEQPLEFIELDHPETYQGLMLLSYLGILTADRVAEIVAS